MIPILTMLGNIRHLLANCHLQRKLGSSPPAGCQPARNCNQMGTNHPDPSKCHQFGGINPEFGSLPHWQTSALFNKQPFIWFFGQPGHYLTCHWGNAFLKMEIMESLQKLGKVELQHLGGDDQSQPASRYRWNEPEIHMWGEEGNTSQNYTLFH